MLTQWLEIRADHDISGRDPVICMLDVRPLADSYIRVLFPRLGRQAGIAKRVHAHGSHRARLLSFDLLELYGDLIELIYHLFVPRNLHHY